MAGPSRYRGFMTTRTQLPAQTYAFIALALVGAFVPFAPALAELYDIWNLRPEYSYGIVIPFISAFLIWRQRHELTHLQLTGSWYGLPLIAAGLVLRVIGDLTTMYTVVHYAFLLVLYGVVLSLTGGAVFRRLWMPLLILVFMVPLPSFFTQALSLQLQLLSSALGVLFIRMAGISVLLEGNVIDLGSYQLQVAEACDGLRYLFPLMTLGFIVGYVFRGPMWKRVAVFLASVPIAVLMNSLRIGVIGITVEHWGQRMAEGVLHDFEGWVVFMLSTATLLLFAAGLARLGPSGKPWSETFDLSAPLPTPKRAQPAALLPPQRVPRAFIVATILVATGALAVFAMPQPRVSAPPRADFIDFPNHLGGWVGHRSALEKIYLDALDLDDYVISDYTRGNGPVINFYSSYYTSQDTERAVHSPRNCIPGGGWEITRIERRELPAEGGKRALPFNRVVIQIGNRKQLVYYWFEQRGRRLTNEYAVKWYLFWDAVTRHRTDGALVRLVAALPPDSTEEQVDAELIRFARLVEPELPRFVPN